MLLVLAVMGLAGVAVTQNMRGRRVMNPPPPSPTPVVAIPTPAPAEAVSELPGTNQLANWDPGRPIITPVPTATVAPTAAPAPTAVPFAEGWKVKAVIGSGAILLDGKNGDRQRTVTLGEVYDESLNPASREEYDAGRTGVLIVSFDQNNRKALVRNHDGREKEIPPHQTRTPGR